MQSKSDMTLQLGKRSSATKCKRMRKLRRGPHTSNTIPKQQYWMPSPSFSDICDNENTNRNDSNIDIINFYTNNISTIDMDTQTSSSPSPSLSSPSPSPSPAMKHSTTIKIIIRYFYRKSFIHSNDYHLPLTQYILNILYCFSFLIYEFEDISLNDCPHIPPISSPLSINITTSAREDEDDEHDQYLMSNRKKIPIQDPSPTFSYTIDSYGCNTLSFENSANTNINNSSSDTSTDTDDDYIFLSFQVSNSLSSTLFASTPVSSYNTRNTRSYSNSHNRSVNSKCSSRVSTYNKTDINSKSSLILTSNGTQSSAKLESNAKWKTVFYGPLLYREIFNNSTFVCNVKIEQSAYGIGIAFFGIRDISNDRTVPHLQNIIINKKNGLPDDMNDCFVIYDNGEYHDWNSINSSILLNINEGKQRKWLKKQQNGCKIKTPEFKTIDKIGSKYIDLRRIKRDFMSNKKPLFSMYSTADEHDDHQFIDTDVDMITKIRIRKQKMYNWYHRSSKKKIIKKQKKVYERFGFEAKCDILQISMNLKKAKIMIHNLTTHQCLVLSKFDYSAIRMAFVMRNAEITIIDHKWYSC